MSWPWNLAYWKCMHGSQSISVLPECNRPNAREYGFMSIHQCHASFLYRAGCTYRSWIMSNVAQSLLELAYALWLQFW